MWLLNFFILRMTTTHCPGMAPAMFSGQHNPAKSALEHHRPLFLEVAAASGDLQREVTQLLLPSLGILLIKSLFLATWVPVIV